MARYPVNQPYRITTTFGVPDPNAKFGRHSGIDFAVPKNRPIYAPTTGTVTFAGWSPTGGNMVQISDGKYYHRLMHNESLQVVVGQRVAEGSQVAYAGSTGLSTGVHCHWDVATWADPPSFAAFVDPNSIINNQEDDMPLPSDDDILNMKRSETGVPTYQPPGDELRFYKDPANGWKRLAYDTRQGMQVQIDLAKQNSGGKAQEKLEEIKKIIKE